MEFIFRVIVCFFGFITFQCFANKPFVVVVASYNNENYVEENLRSVFEQNYDNFRLVYVNDASTDSTLEKVMDMISKYNFSHKSTVIDVKDRRGGLANHHLAITKYVKPEEIVVLLDGDDALLGKNVLKYLNSIYSVKHKKVWFSFGQFIHSSNNAIGFCTDYPEEVVEKNLFRNYDTMPSHLKTFYAWLFLKININDLQHKGKFFPATGDLAIVLPILEMAGENYQFIDHPLYIYNDENPLNDHKVNEILQNTISRYIRNLPKYEPLGPLFDPSL